MRKLLSLLLLCALGVGVQAKPKPDSRLTFIEQNIKNAERVFSNQLKASVQGSKLQNPITMNKDGKVVYGSYIDWRSGFFPGSLWYLYELTGNEQWARQAEAYTNSIEEAKTITSHHDIGFIVNCSFGNGLRLKNIESYKDVIVTAAKSLSTRFRPAGGVIQSWNVSKKPGGNPKGWECPVIIDNMMNLELMFKSTIISGDSTYYRMAVSHADRTLKEQFRPDGSCYHVVDYGLIDGKVHHRNTAQGYADESVWSRGQAWAIYGFTMCYRYTRFKRYLDQAIKTFHMMKNHKNLAADHIPYWDMDAPKIPDEPRDASTAAIMASALYELATLDIDNYKEYKDYADTLIESLSSSSYLAKPGTNANFLLMHSTGSVPHGAEIDKPLNYADYYYLEALTRKAYMELYFQKMDK